MTQEELKAEMNKIKARLEELQEPITRAMKAQDHYLSSAYLQEAAQLQIKGRLYALQFMDLRKMEGEGQAAVAFVEEILGAGE